MNPLTTNDASLGGILIGVFLTLAGIGIMRLVRSEVYDRWQVRKAERIFAAGVIAGPHPSPFAHTLDAGGDEYADRDAIANTTGMRDSLAEARHMRDALRKLERAEGRVHHSVPVQGKPGAWS